MNEMASIAFDEWLNLKAERDHYRKTLESIRDQPMQFTMPRDDSYWSRLAMQLATMAKDATDFGAAINTLGEKPASSQLLNITKGMLDHCEVSNQGCVLALENAADFIHSHHGDPNTETGWDTDEACDAWLKCRAAIDCAKA